MAQNSIQDRGDPVHILWRVRLFDGPALESAHGDESRRFRSRKVGALLAYLALRVGHACPREELYEALWPEEETQVVANRLRVALASLRRQLEPVGVPFGTVLDVSEPGLIRLRAETVWCDVIAFEQAWKAGRKEEAARLARGPLLPGYYEEWILAEQTRLEWLREELGSAGPAESAPAIASAPPPAAANPPQHRLPLYLTRFFGREEERRQLQERIAGNRLVVLTGPGGIGKTRLAVETAQQMALPCLFVPLAELPNADRVPEAVLQALGILSQADADPAAHLIEVLQHRAPLLLILDNAETLVEAVAALSLRLLEAVPDLHLLITSRQRLDIPGETILALRSLEPPPYIASPERLLEFPAIVLFLDRAQNARPDFTLTARHAEALVEICRRLEGMPLALELAAARVTAQSPAQIAAALATSLMDLKSRQRGLAERHRSLRAAIQGSYDLLPADLRAFFAQLSVFQGGWTAEAARAVTACADAEAFLEELVVRSLVVAREEAADGTMRYAFLETLRQFAAEQLSAEEQVLSAQRHADYFLVLAAEVQEDDIRSLAPLDAEPENLLLALEGGRKAPDESFWKGLIGALIHAFIRGHHRVAVRWIDENASAVTTIADPRLRSRLRYAVCLILPDIGRFEETERIAREMQADAEANGDPVGAAFAGIILGYVANARGDMETAVRLHRAALVAARRLQDASLLQSGLSHASGTLFDYGVLLGAETDAGRAVLQEAETLARELRALVPPYSRRVSLAALLLASPLLALGRKDEGYAFLKETQRACIALGTTSELMYAFIHESELALDRGCYEQAVLRYGAFLALQERMGYSLARAQAVRPAWIQRMTGDLTARLGQETFDSLVYRGRQTPPERFAADFLPGSASPRKD